MRPRYRRGVWARTEEVAGATGLTVRREDGSAFRGILFALAICLPIDAAILVAFVLILNGMS